MPVCSFYLRGQCKFGETCRNEHPPNAGRQTGFGNSSWTNPNRNPSSQNAKGGNLPLLFTQDSLANELTAERPIWPLASYGPAKFEPTLLVGLDESPEELRVRASAASRAGNPGEYIAYEANKISAAEQVVANARSNVAQLYDRAVKQSNPSALFAAGGMSSSGTTTTTSAFGGPTTTSASAFGTQAPGASSAFGAPSAFGQFGKPSAFGQTSAFGQQQQQQQRQQGLSAFGQPAAGQAASAFGQPQPQQAQQLAFGQSSLIKPGTGAFGSLTSTGTTSAFGAAAAGGTGAGGGFSAFAGQPSAFGATAAKPAPMTGGSVFGQPSFGTTSTPGAGGGFSAFAGQGASAFGAPSAFAPQSQQQQLQPPPPPPQPQPQSAFGAPSPFAPAQTQMTTSPFADASKTVQSPFSAFAPVPARAPAPGPAPAAPSSGGPSLTIPPPISAFPSTSISAPSPMTLSTSMQPAPASGQAAQGDQPPDFAHPKSGYKPGSTPYDALLPPNYAELLPERALDAFRSARFELGGVPDWTPPVELR